MGTKQFFHFFHSLFFFYVGNCSNAEFKTRSNSSWCWLWNRRFCFLHGEGMTCDKSLFIVQCIYAYSSGLFTRLLDKPLELLVKRKCWYFTNEIRKINFILIEISFLTTLFFFNFSCAESILSNLSLWRDLDEEGNQQIQGHGLREIIRL